MGWRDWFKRDESAKQEVAVGELFFPARYNRAEVIEVACVSSTSVGTIATNAELIALHYAAVLESDAIKQHFRNIGEPGSLILDVSNFCIKQYGTLLDTEVLTAGKGPISQIGTSRKLIAAVEQEVAIALELDEVEITELEEYRRTIASLCGAALIEGIVSAAYEDFVIDGSMETQLRDAIKGRFEGHQIGNGYTLDSATEARLWFGSTFWPV